MSLNSKDLKSSEVKSAPGANRKEARNENGPRSPPGKDRARGETPVSGYENQFIEVPLEEDPIPEQRSFRQAALANNNQHQIRESRDFNIGLHELPKQPFAHDDPGAIDASPISVVPSVKLGDDKLAQVDVPEKIPDTEKKGEQINFDGVEEAKMEALNALKV